MSHQQFSEPPRSGATLSRRRLLHLSLATAAAVPFGLATARPAIAGNAPDPDEAYRTAMRDTIAKNARVLMYAETGREFLYRPRQILVADKDVQRVAQQLTAMGLRFDLANRFAGVVKVVFATDVDVPALVKTLRDPAKWPRQDPPIVQPHHVTVGHIDNIMGNPDGAPAAAASPGWPPPVSAADGAGVLIGVCDTGICADATTMHPLWLGGSYVPEAQDEDPLYLTGDELALEAGHGTFVAGVLRRSAPGVRFDPAVALDDSGLGDEESLVTAIGRLDPGVSIINLSLGYFTQDDSVPEPVKNTVTQLGKDVVVVASAGNSAGSRMSWPAALPEVLAVAAVTKDPKSGQLAATTYTNFGSWVGACAEGERVSTYVKGQMQLSTGPIPFVGYARWRGTSFAAPHVAGRLAAVMTKYGYTAAQARAYLESLARWHPDYGVFVA